MYRGCVVSISIIAYKDGIFNTTLKTKVKRSVVAIKLKKIGHIAGM